MKKNNLFIASAALIALGSSVIAPISAHAADTNPTSTGKVTLTAGDTTKPTDPVDPLVPADPENPGTGQVGDLTIDFVRNVDFGKDNALTGNQQTIANTNKQTYVQVTDKRGTGTGWQLNVTGSEMKSATHTLAGAKITLPKGTTESKDVTNTAAPTSAAVEIALDGKAAAMPVMTAAKDTGLGTWTDVMTPEDIKLSVPSNAYVGDYTTTLTWTLTNSATA